MKLLKSFGILFLSLAVCSVVFSQNISGVVNTYTNVTATGANTVTVGTAAGLAIGDKVLLIQMKGATITTGNVVGFGNITAYGNAGNYEYLTIASIAGNVVTMTSNLCQTYTTTGAVQLIRVPVYTNPVITAPVTCTPWNGTIGGVVAFEATGTLTFNSNINVAGSGFRGGATATGFFSCGDPNFANGTAGKKGEGIAAAPAGQDANRRPLANGGGGSNTGNPGAGGGGNYGAGGRGGNEFYGCGATTSFGVGGLALTTVATKIFMGGGGGGGFGDNGMPVTPGSNGGGLVMIKANQITGNGNSILANGADITANTDSEGAGAGGGGGAVYLWCPTYTSTLNINVKGGNGGNINNTIWNGSCHGPGGGGGAGYTWFSTAATPGGVAVNIAGGNPGLVLNSGPCISTSNQAAAGTAGASLFNLPTPAPPSPLANLGNDTTICNGQSITLQLPNTYSSYLWSTGATSDTLVVSVSGTYWVEVPIGCGAVDRDTIVINIGNPAINLGADQSFCSGDSAVFNAGAGYASYAWSTGATSSSITVTTVGTYDVTITDAFGCTASDTVSVSNVYPNPVINFGPDTAQCGGSILLNPGAGYAGYLWQNNATSNTQNVTATGTYWVNVVDSNTCTGGDTINITINPAPNPNLGPDISFCSGNSATLNPGNFISYNWSTGATTQTITVTTAGTYWVQVTNVNGCTNTDTLIVQNVYPLPQPNLGPDQSVCSGTAVILNPGTFATYQWSNGTTGNTLSVSNNGIYHVTVTTANNCTNSDTAQVSFYPLPSFTLGPDLEICPGDNITLTPAGPSVPVTHLWNDNTTGGSLVLYDIGTYWLTVTDTNLCTFTDTVVVTIDCPATIYVPNAFTPNSDEINPVFMAYGSNIKLFRMEIFNRWGQLIYIITDINTGWNGMLYSGLPAPQGEYIYKISYQDYIKADDKYIFGGFALIR